MNTLKLLLLIAVFATTASAADDADARAANVALAHAFETAWNAHEMDPGMRRLVTDDIDWVNVDGGWGSGIDRVVGGHVNVHKMKFRESVLTIKEVTVDFVRPDVAAK